MSTETVSPARTAAKPTLLEPVASKSTLSLTDTRPRQDSVISNGTGSVKSVSRPDSRADAAPNSSGSDGYESETSPHVPPIPGFVVAGSKRNADFHELFPNVPEMDYLIQDYGCAWHRDILIQGRLYISENHLCFYANIFGWITSLTIPFLDVLGLEKRMTAYVIPNAILVQTYSGEYTFASFLTRDTVFDVMQSLWHPPPKPPGQLENATEGGTAENGQAGGDEVAGEENNTPGHAPTQCACGKNNEHYPTPVIDTVIPGTPEKIYDLMFKSEFISNFLSVDQKLMDIQTSEWTPKEPESTLLTRDISFIKPLTGSFGPKQAKCEIKEEQMHIDFDDYASMLTTTRTPEVPSGGLFSVKTRACLMWARAASTRLVVTTTVEWTGRSFIRGVVDRSAIDGQKTYHQDLEKAMRKHIAAHRSEFVPKGTANGSTNGDTGDISIASDTGEVVESPIETTDSKQSDITQMAISFLEDGFAQLKGIRTTNALGVLVVILAISNIWSLLGPRAEPRLPGDAQALKKQRKATRDRKLDVADARVEIRELRRTMEAIEKRLAKIEASLTDLD
ncbi:membrane protein [Ceratobasidium sp. AG-Ba]|nr:membrane protein [Ceratobasidium sp. AG-Ba]